MPEIVRWICSLGIWYIIFPLVWLRTGFIYERFIEINVIERLGFARFPLGTIILIGGTILAFSAYHLQITRGRGHPFAFTGRENFARPTEVLLTDGIYYWSRNPMNFGDAMIYAGLSLFAGCDGGLVINTPLYYLAVLFNSRFLERKGLIERFGETYLNYENTTSVFLPGIKSIGKALTKRK